MTVVSSTTFSASNQRFQASVVMRSTASCARGRGTVNGCDGIVSVASTTSTTITTSTANPSWPTHLGLLAVVDEFHDLFAGDELPDAVGADDDHAVLGRERAVVDLRGRDDADRVRDGVPERARHGESGDVLVGEPDTRRAVDAVFVLHGEDAASGGEDALLLGGERGLVVAGELLDDAAVALLLREDGARVADVQHVELAAADEHDHGRGAAELRLDEAVCRGHRRSARRLPRWFASPSPRPTPSIVRLSLLSVATYC